jgi:EAL domain-containing protein (putative c-di-GMP-specific phosphodiesterase class I)
LYYQPKIDLRTGKIAGSEALLRWPSGPSKNPAEFIPIAEKSGLIIQIGQWAFETACRQLRRWQQDGLPETTVAVNLSIVQFKDPDLPRMILRTIQEAGLAPRLLELELTEQAFVHDRQTVIAMTHELHSAGVHVSIDDFGTGYSSLSYVKQFPVDTLKIDRMFIRDVFRDSKNSVITPAIIQMAHSLGLKVVAEGVETEAELEFLKLHECDMMQGFLFSRPLPAKDFAPLLLSGKTLS